MPPIQPARKEGKVYQNTVPTSQKVEGGMLKTFWQFFTTKNNREPEQPLGPFRTNPTVYNSEPANGLRITWIGHSSLIIEIDGKRLLTDPVWGERASFSNLVGPKRFFEPPLPLTQLPYLDAIILSHDHYDHLDYPTIKQFALMKTPIYCSEGVGPIIEKWGISKSRITEMNWGTTVKVGDDLTITATPARHFSGRSLSNRNQTLWSSFVIKGHTHNIFFGADSGYFPGFKDIGEHYGPFDLTMLEIGAYGEGWPNIHMGPDNASNAHLDLGGKIMMPIHWGTFNLALHPWKEPIERLEKHAQQKGIKLFVPTPGEPTEVTEHNTKWWTAF